MSDELGNPSSFLGDPGEPVAEVDPEELKNFWLKTCEVQARFPGQTVSFSRKALGKFGPFDAAVWYRSSMILLLARGMPEQLSPWIKDGEPSDAVFRAMATIPMEWIGHEERQGLPFDIEEFFERLGEAGSGPDRATLPA